MGFPNLPGIPALLGNFIPSGLPALLTGDSPAASVSTGGARWGIYSTGGAQLLTPDSVLAIDYKHDWHISDYPIEDGSFFSYNKVQTPFENRVVMTKGGTVADRRAFLAALESLAGSLTLCNVVTPEYTFLNVNVAHIDYRRSSTKGAGLITVEVVLTEIRLTATTSFNNTKAPGSATPIQIGASLAGIPSLGQIGSITAAAQSIASGSLSGITQTALGALGGLSSVTGLSSTLLSSVQGWGSNLSMLAKLPGLAAGTLNLSSLSALASGKLRSWGNASAAKATAIITNALTPH